MIDADIVVRAAAGSRRVSLSSYLEPHAEEQAHEDTYRWIKHLRNLPVDGAPFRARFTVRDDSLWWFTEIYLHKEQVVLDIHRAIAALQALITRETPERIDVTSGSPLIRYLAPRVALSRGLRGGGGVPDTTWWTRLAQLDLRARSLTLSAALSADRYRPAPPADRPTGVAAFVHRAFWREGGDDGSAESYIGPVLEALEQKTGGGAMRYVGIGPSTNFRSARRWRPLRDGGSAVVPVERFAPRRALQASRTMWRRRLTHFRLMARASSLRAAAVIGGIDCWPLVREQLAGIAWLQWPWSVRAMDEAAATLDALRPNAVVTYAEAGGWGRALILEARRRGIPSVGLQHGFIYRHWLNYRHEPDEMENHFTAPFPYPTRTLVFDPYAARHLREQGRFPDDAVAVTGSPRLDELIRAVDGVRADGAGRVRTQLALAEADSVVLIATKEREARAALAAFVTAVSGVPGATLVIKPHPAETADAYSNLVRSHPQVRVVSAGTSLADLLAVARAVVTVNSTVALDAGVFDIPALVIGLPNNLSPFVDAGALAGSRDPSGLAELLRHILYDERFRQQLAVRRRDVLGDRPARANGRAAAAAADVVLALTRKGLGDVAGSG